MSLPAPWPPAFPRKSASRAVSTDLKEGDVLGGKFRIERLVGRGGMGVVMEATNVQLEQKVAIKLLARNADDPSVVERFIGEAKAAARLKSEHVARVFDVGKDPTHGPFIVMELLDGDTLAQLLAKSGRVPLHKAVEHVIDACEGLAEAHARGIVHQDIKPANLFLVTGDDGRPSVKVLDFGIATMRSNHEARETPAADAKSSAPRSQGTPAYLSPEQLKGSPPIDHRADVWALGCVLYELVAAEKAFRSQRFTELVTKILESPPDTLPVDLDLPLPVAQIIDRCLQKDPTKRYNSTGELALALLPYARRRAHSSVAKAVAHVKTGGLDPDLQMPSSMPPPPNVADSGEVAIIPRAPSVPSFSTAPVEKSSSPPPKSRVAIVAAVVFGAVALGGVAFGISKSIAPDEPDGPKKTAAPPAPTAPSETQPVVASATSPGSETTPPLPPPILIDSNSLPLDAPQVTIPTNSRPAPFRPRTRTSGAATPSAPTPGESEIRHTR
jgi:serine/threonine protein kinase